MMELVMSRVWMVIAGTVLAGVVMAAFSGLDERTENAVTMEGASTLARTIISLSSGEHEGVVVIEADDILPAGHRHLTICDGSIWIVEGPSARAVVIPLGTILLDGEARTDRLMVVAGDVLIIRSCTSTEGSRTVQLEKVSATNLTASTNLLHSSAVL